MCVKNALDVPMFNIDRIAVKLPSRKLISPKATGPKERATRSPAKNDIAPRNTLPPAEIRNLYFIEFVLAVSTDDRIFS